MPARRSILRLGIRTKLTLIFILFAVLLLVSVGLLSYRSGRLTLQAAITSDLLSTAIEKQSALNAWISEAQADITAVATSPHLVDTLEILAISGEASEIDSARQEIYQEIRHFTGDQRLFLNLMVIEAETGKVLVSTSSEEQGSLKADRQYFINAQNGPYVQNVYYSAELQGPSMTAAAPIVSSGGRLLGVLAGRLNLDEMNAIIQRRTGLRRSIDSFLVNASGLVVTQPRFISDPAVLEQVIDTQAVRDCLARNNGVLLAPDYRQVPAIIVYRWLPESQLCMINKVDQAEAFAPSHSFGQTWLAIGAISLLAALGAAYWLAQTITRPVLALQAGAARFGRGELDLRLPESSQDELGLLAREFNHMAASLADKEEQLRAYAEDLEQKVAQRTEALQISEAGYRGLFESVPVGLYRTTPEGSILDANQALVRLLAFPDREDLLSTAAPMMYVDPADRLRWQETLQQSGLVEDFETQIRRRDGEVIWIQHSARAVTDQSGAIQHYEGAVKDITGRKRAEQALQRHTDELARSNSELEQFAYVASHDLQEPLRMVSSYVQLLERRYKDKLDADANDFIAYAVDGANRMKRLINDLLAYSRVNTRGREFQPTDCSVVLDHVLDDLKLLIEDNLATIDRDALPTVKADEVQIEQLFQNLIGNAIKFRSQRPPEIGINARRGKGEWVFSIQDNGIGIDPQYFERIFVIFQRLHAKVEYPGTGIGLAISKRIVERHGGRIWVESQPAKGSTFYFTLPYEPAGELTNAVEGSTVEGDQIWPTEDPVKFVRSRDQ